MSLKQHNDIVEKLLKQINSKDSEIESLKKQLHKAAAPNANHLKTLNNEKELNRKITQLQKEYKEKIQALQQQIRSRSIENKDLKDRMNTLKKLEAKQKEQTTEILKKTANMASYDPKFAAVVSHYETQVQKKDKHIANLQKQIKDNFYKMKMNGIETKNNQIENEEENDGMDDNITAKASQMLNDDHYHTKYQQEINTLKFDNNKMQRLLDEKSKEFKDLTRRYSELTKEYYRVINEYGEQEENGRKNEDYSTNAHNQMKKKPATGIGKILAEMVEDDNSSVQSQSSLSYSFLSNYHKTKEAQKKQNEEDEESEVQYLSNMVETIQEMVGASNRIEIVPILAKMKNKSEQAQIFQNISKCIHSMMYRLGMGKVPMSMVIPELEKLETRIGKLMESSDLLDELCIEVGAKREKVLQKIGDLKATQELFFKNMKDVDFMQKLPKSNKIIEFISYFELEKEQCELPDQLHKMYEQLKYVDRFLKHSAIILNKEPQGLERSLESILRYLERKEAEENLIIDQKNQKQIKQRR